VQQKYQFDDYAEKVIDVCELVAGTEMRRDAASQGAGLRVHRAA